MIGPGIAFVAGDAGGVLMKSHIGGVADAAVRPSTRRSGDRIGTQFAVMHESEGVQILWGERRGHGTMGAVQRLPTELPPCRNIFVLTRARPSPLSSKIAQSSP